MLVHEPGDRRHGHGSVGDMSAPTENRPLNIVVWNENVHESRGDETVLGTTRTACTP